LETERLHDDENKLRNLIIHRKLRRLVIPDPICLASVSSTQLFMEDQLRSSIEGDLVISRVQTAGMGRENRVWFSQPGGLWLTVTLCPPRPEILPELPRMATTAIVRAMDIFGLPGCTIKLPNDVYCEGQKIAGVLADARVIGSRSIVYLGMGINVNNDPSEISTISQISTSFKLKTGHTLALLDFAADLLKNLDAEYDRGILSYGN
jgi:BirA family transcriptional regulator, biotin operon repressor / biotin---[acetyl-CoA-carboxylase] ligase